MRVKYQKGGLATIASILGDCNISIDSFLQKPDDNDDNEVTLLFATHTCKESDVKRALEKIGALEFVLARPNMIRIEE